MVAPLPGIASIIKRAKKKWRTWGKSSLLHGSPLLFVQGDSLWCLLPTSHCSGTSPRSREPGKDILFWLHAWMPWTKAGFLGKVEENRYGQERENKPCLAQRPPRTRSTGFADWNRLRFFPLEKAPFHYYFLQSSHNLLRKLVHFHFPGALKNIFLVHFFQPQKWGAGGWGGAASAVDRPEQGSYLPSNKQDGRLGELFELGTGTEGGWRFNYAIS